jgi:putative transposase
VLVRVLCARDDGREGRCNEATQAHPRAGHPQAASGRAVAERGKTTAGVARHLEVSENTYHRWQRQFGGMKADDARRLRELERENATLMRIVADKELENVALKEIAKGNW